MKNGRPGVKGKVGISDIGFNEREGGGGIGSHVNYQ